MDFFKKGIVKLDVMEGFSARLGSKMNSIFFKRSALHSFIYKMDCYRTIIRTNKEMHLHSISFQITV